MHSWNRQTDRNLEQKIAQNRVTNWYKQYGENAWLGAL